MSTSAAHHWIERMRGDSTSARWLSAARCCLGGSDLSSADLLVELIMSPSFLNRSTEELPDISPRGRWCDCGAPCSRPGCRGEATQAKGMSFLRDFLPSGQRRCLCPGDGRDRDEPERFWPRSSGDLTSETVGGASMNSKSICHVFSLFVASTWPTLILRMDTPGALSGVDRSGSGGPGVGDSRLEESLSIIESEPNSARADATRFSSMRGEWRVAGRTLTIVGAQRRAALVTPLQAYQAIMGLDGSCRRLGGTSGECQRSRSSQLQTLMSSASISGSDRLRLEQHFDTIRELSWSQLRPLGGGPGHDRGGLGGSEDSDGDLVMQAVRAHMDVASLAVACGYTRSVAIRVGDGNDGRTRYRDPESGESMETSTTSRTGGSLMARMGRLSRLRSSSSQGGPAVCSGIQVSHRPARSLCAPSGSRLIDCGFAAWYNDLGGGPGHSNRSTPCIVAGSAGGFLRQGDRGPHRRGLRSVGE